MFGPKINHRLYRTTAREFVLNELEDHEDWRLEGSVPSAQEIQAIGLRLFADMERGKASLEFLLGLMCDYWASRAPATWQETVRNNLERAMSEYWDTHDAQEAARLVKAKAAEIERRKVLEERLAAEKAEKEKREHEARAHKLIAKEFNISIRHARNLRNEGTSDRERATRLAEIAGGDPSDYLRKGRRKRETDLVKMFMAAEHAQVSFTHFITDPDEVVTVGALKAFLKENVRKLTWGEELYSLETLVDRARDLGYESLSLEEAEDLWKAYKLWRIGTISSIASYDVEDGR